MATAETLVLLSDVDGLYTADPRRDPEAAPPAAWSRRSRPRSRPWPAAPAPRSAPAAWRPSWPPPGSPPRPAARVVLAKGHVDRPLTRHRGRRPRHPVPGPPLRDGAPARTGSPPASGVARAPSRSTPAPSAPSSAAPPCCPPASPLVEGEFERGDAVLVRAADGSPVAKGLVAYDAAEARRLAGRRTRGDRVPARLARPRRADPSRRPRAPLTLSFGVSRGHTPPGATRPSLTCIKAGR